MNFLQPLKKIQSQLGQWSSQAYQTLQPVFSISETKILVVLAVAVGLITGVAIFIVDIFIEGMFQNLITPNLEAPIGGSFFPRGWIFILPATGGLLLPLIYHFAPEVKGHGTPEVIYSVSHKGGPIRGRVAILKTLATALSIGTGGSGGREGPIAHIGASLGSKLARIFRLPPAVVKTTVACGAASGIAAAFNAPLGGIFFAMEIVMGRITSRPFQMVVLSTVVASAVSRGLQGGSASYFTVPKYVVGHWMELILYVVLGLFAGVVGKIFVRFEFGIVDAFNAWRKLHPRWRPAVGGLFVGVIGYYLPEVLGTGHGVIEAVLHNKLPFLIVGMLLFGKIVATSFTLGSGGSGGIFMPSLFIGAMMGSVLGNAFSAIFPFVQNPGGYAMVGMAAMFAAVTHAPLTAMLLLFEMTYDYAIILPVMLSTISAVFVARYIMPETVYTESLRRRGVVLQRESETPLLDTTLVKTVMTKKVDTLSPELTLDRLTRYIQKSRHTGFPVVDVESRMIGLVTQAEVHDAFSSGDLPEKGIIVQDIMREHFPTVTPSNTLSEALQRIQSHRVDRVPVVEDTKSQRLVGIVTQADILNVYRKAVAH